MEHHLQIEKATMDWAEEFSFNMIDRAAKRAVIAGGAMWILFGDSMIVAGDWMKARWYEGWEFTSMLWGYTVQGVGFVTDMVERMAAMAEDIAEEMFDLWNSLERLANSFGVSLDDLLTILNNYLKGIPGIDGGLPDWDDLWPDDDEDGDGGFGDFGTDKAEIAELLQRLAGLIERKEAAADRFDFAEVARLEVEIALVIAELKALGVNV